MIRVAHHAIGAAIAPAIAPAIALAIPLALAPSAHAQFNPFFGARNPLRLTNGDYRLLNESAAKLNANPEAHVGEVQSWSNPTSGASGNVTLGRIFQSQSMTCHALRYNISVRARSGSSEYDVTWCRTPSGEWKITS